MDENEKATLEQQIEEALTGKSPAPTDTPVIELASDEDEKTPEVVEEESSEDANADEAAKTEEEPKTRKDRRIERLLEKLGTSDEDAMDLKKPEPYKPLKLEEDDYAVKDLEADREKYAKANRELGEYEGFSRAETNLKVEIWTDKLESDKERVETKYPELDKDSEKFDPDLANSINRLYLKTVDYRVNPTTKEIRIGNPRVRYNDFVDGFIAIAERVADTRNAETATNIAKQASKTGVRPQGGSRKTLELTPENIRDMDSATFEKNRDAINAQIMKMLGQ